MGRRHLLSPVLATQPRPAVVAHVCDDIACRIRGGESALRRAGARAGPGRQAATERATWKRSPCLGRCERAPAVLVTDRGRVAASDLAGARERPASSDRRDRRARSDRHGVADGRAASNRCALGAAGRAAGRSACSAESGGSIPRASTPIAPRGGYAGAGAGDRARPGRRHRARSSPRSSWAAAVRRFRPAASGTRWRRPQARPHYVVCNADESEPGTFKDRVLMEEDPFAVVEGMTIAGLRDRVRARVSSTCAASIRCAAERMAGAIAAARAAGLLGADVMGAGFAFDIELRRGAGAYICGEETALFNSIEGKRGEPRNKPPFPVQVGLFGKPTVVNNVETLVNVPVILSRGRRGLRRHRHRGLERARSSSASRARWRAPGVYEVAFGITLRQLHRAGGRRPAASRSARCCWAAPRACSSGPDELDMPLTFEGTRAIGATLGSGVVLVFDETIDLRRHPARASRRSSATSRAASACPAASARCGRKSCSRGSGRGRPIGVGRRGDGAAQGDRPGDARRLDLRARADGVERHRVGASRRSTRCPSGSVTR